MDLIEIIKFLLREPIPEKKEQEQDIMDKILDFMFPKRK